LFLSVFTSVKDIERQLSRTLWPERQSGDLQSASGSLGPPYPAVFRVIPGGMPEVSRSSVRKEEKTMPLIQILLALIVVGVLLWLVNRFIPMAKSIKSILNAVVVIAVVLWLLNVFGLFHSLSRIHVGT
jgi:hypothetical protein